LEQPGVLQGSVVVGDGAAGGSRQDTARKADDKQLGDFLDGGGDGRGLSLADSESGRRECEESAGKGGRR